MLSLAKRTTRGCPWDYNVKHYPLKPLNGRLNIVLGRPKGAGMLKHLGLLKVGLETTRVISIEILIELTLGIGYVRPLSQPRVGLVLR